MITAEDSVRDVLKRRPATRVILDRHGLLGCGGPDGPEEPIGTFARLHDVDVDQLLGELNEAPAATPARLPLMESAGPQAGGEKLYRPFMTTAMILTLTLGATWGVVNLAWIMYALGPVPASHVQAHGQVQVFGFLFLFIMGVACQVIPRFANHPLRFPEFARASLGFMVAGVLARSIGQPFGYTTAGRFALVMSGALYVMSTASFALVVISTAKSAMRSPGPAKLRAARMRMEPYILAGIFWMIVSSIVAAIQAIVMADRGLTSLSVTWQRPLWFFALFGAILSWVFGIGSRVLPGFLSTRPARAPLVRAGFVALQGGLLLMGVSSIAFAAGRPEIAREFKLLAMTGVGVSILLTFVALHGLQPAPDARPSLTAPGASGNFLRAGFRWAVVAAVLLLFSAGFEWTTGREPHSLLQDATRHVFTIGALMMILFGMVSRILPVFEGVPLAHPRVLTGSFHALNIGALLRMAQVGAAYAWPSLMAVAGASGFFVLAGVVGMAFVVFGTLRRGGLAPGRVA